MSETATPVTRARKSRKELDRAVIRTTAIERFSVGRMVDEYMAAYDEIIQSAGVRSRGRTPSVRH